MEEEQDQVQPHRRGVLRPPSGSTNAIVGAVRKSLGGELLAELAEGQDLVERESSKDASSQLGQSYGELEEHVEEQESPSGQAALQGSQAQQLALQKNPLRTRKINRKNKLGKSSSTVTQTRSLARMHTSYRSRTTVEETSENALVIEAANKLVRAVASATIAGMQEAKALKATAIQVVDDAFGPESDAIADRITGKLITSTFPTLDDDDDDHNVRAAKHGVEEQYMQAELRRQSTQRVKDMCGIRAADRKSEFDKLKANGRYHCGAAEADLRIKQAPKEEISGNEEKDEETRVMLQRQKTQLRESGIDTSVEQADNMTTKTQFGVQTIEELWLQSQSGALRKKPEAYEAVFDFQNGRVTVPRYLNGHTAGQLQDVQPNLNAPRTRGIVTVRTLVPRRSCVATATYLEDVCDIKKMERQTLKIDQRNHGATAGATLHGQGHLHAYRKLPITTDLDEWNLLQQIKRQRQEEEENLQQQENLQEEHAQDSDSGDSGHSGGGESDALPEISQGNRRVAVRGNIQLQVSIKAQPPWDVRPQPDGTALKQFLHKIGLGHQLKNKSESSEAAEDGAPDKFEQSPKVAQTKLPRQSKQTAMPRQDSLSDEGDGAGATTHVNLSERNHGLNAVVHSRAAGDVEQQGGRRLPNSCGWC